jgi:CubicO group peptidase (beta-lactamase class C family)
MRVLKSLIIATGLFCISANTVAQPLPWVNQIAVYDLDTYDIHLPFFFASSKFYDVHLDHLISNPYTTTLGPYGLSAPVTPDPAYYAVLNGGTLRVPVLQVGSFYYDVSFVVTSTSPYTFQASQVRSIPAPNPLPTAACGFVPQVDSKLASLMSRMQAKLATNVAVTNKPSGAIVAVVKDGQLLSAQGMGMRSKTTYGKETEPVDRETLFWIASTSKFIAASGAMTLVDAGVLDVTTPVTSYLPGFAEQSGLQDLITMDNLLKMKSGLSNDGGCYLLSVSASESPEGCASVALSPSDNGVLANLFQPTTLTMWPWSVFNNTVYGIPGSAPWNYSNWGYMLAGRVMEAVSGKQYPQIIQDNVFVPANMCLATYDPYTAIAYDNYAIGSGSQPVDGQCPEPELGHDSYAPWMADELACPARNPNGGVWASAIDLGHFAQALMGDLNGQGTILSQTAANELINPVTGRANTGGSIWGDTYGYGNFHHTYNGYDIYSHGGGRAGFGTLFWIIPSANFAIATAANIGDTNYFKSELEYAVRCYLDNQCN